MGHAPRRLPMWLQPRGPYLLRGRADDGGLLTDVEVTVVVRAAAS